MAQGGHPRAHVGKAGKVYIRETDALLLAHVEQHLAPGVDDERVAEG
jgi:hypothetical protein